MNRLISKIKYGLPAKANKMWFDFCCREILKTPPINLKNDGIAIVSMVSHQDLVMYLIAIKSFYLHFKKGKITIIDDGSLTEKDKEILNHHVKPCRLISINDIKSENFPRGGTWERLIFISNYVEEDYIIQLDSDTVTFGEIPEVIECIERNQSFVFKSNREKSVEPMKNICRKIKKLISNSVQMVAESNFDKLSECEQFKYMRGCAGFAGFQKGNSFKAELEGFSKEMKEIIGGKWLEWGSEQVASNFILSNFDSVFALPFPKYTSFYPNDGVDYSNSVFLHFIGTDRFKKNVFLEKSKNIIQTLGTESHYE